MANKDFCKHVLQGLLPEIKINDIHYLRKQKKINDPKHHNQKSVILDIMVEDVAGNLYDIEMQRANKEDLGWRMRYYAAKMDQRYTLKKGSTYRKLRNSYVIFFCAFDPQGTHRIRSSYHLYEDTDKTDRLIDGSTKIIINSKGIPNRENQIILNLVNLMNDEPVQDDQYFEEVQAKIKEFNEDPDWRDYIMDYEEKRREREQDAREEGKKEGRAEGKVEGIKQGQRSQMLEDVKILISALKKAGSTKQEIMQQLEQNYSKSFTQKQLTDFLAQS